MRTAGSNTFFVKSSAGLRSAALSAFEHKARRGEVAFHETVLLDDDELTRAPFNDRCSL